MKRCYHVRNKALETDFLGLTFSNPVGLAAGFDKNAEIYREFHAFGFSFIEVGTVTPLGQPGNDRPRSFRIKKDKGDITTRTTAKYRLPSHAPIRPISWYSGNQLTNTSSLVTCNARPIARILARRLMWDRITPFGWPVLPDVY